MGCPLYLIDAFASTPFTGNPAAVVVLQQEVDENWMQDLAMEMNQAETAYVRPIDGGWSLRWFTPLAEVDLCGHATLASAHALWSTGRARGPIAFHTRSGVLTCNRSGESIALDFPAIETTAVDNPALHALFPHARWYGRTRFDWLVELATESEVRDLAPDFAAVAALGERGLIVTARSDGDEQDFVSRFFGPQVGVPEDPVTGSAHCALAVYWSERLGRYEMTGYQASRRGGFVRVVLEGDRVKLIGLATTVLTATLS